MGADLASDAAHIQSLSGEDLRLREFHPDGVFEAIGFRHDLPDGEGRLWRTEAVLRRNAPGERQDIVRIRTQCIALTPEAKLAIPRKPYLIKSILKDGWGGADGKLIVSDQPFWLESDPAGLRVAHEITCGNGTRYLPVVYISAVRDSTWLLSRDQIEKLAYDLGGIAHVVVEPDRSFSFALRDAADGLNVYGGTIALAVPGRGVVRRFFFGLRLLDADDLQLEIRRVAARVRDQLPAMGWDWTELQEEALRLQRERDRRRLSDAEITDLYEEEIRNLKDRISQLEGRIVAGAKDAGEEDEELGSPFGKLANKLGPEIYPGEFSDRIRLAVRECVASSDKISLDRRTLAVLESIAPYMPVSGALPALLDDLKRATKDEKRLASALKAFLGRHGYWEKSNNKHIKMQAKDGYVGLDTITLPKTPSDGRGLVNLRKDIERILGLTMLRD